jgi:hypothetical protein
MMVFSRGIGLAIGALALCFAGAACAQENLDQGKTPAQLFASDCAICHKSPQGLAKAGGILGLESFLREHYTASRESASAIAKYLQSAGNGPAAPVKRAAKKGGKGDEKGKSGEKKPEAGKSRETLPGDNKPPAEAKDSKEPKASESKPAEFKPAESKPAESKPAESKPAESKPAESKPSEAKPADSPKSD